MNTESVKTFITLAESKNFTKAARQLFMAQSTITKRIKDLETEVGQQLFYRTEKGVELTEAGLLFNEYAQKYMELERKVKADIYNSNKYIDTINIGSVKCIYQSHLRKHMQFFLKNNENISINIVNEHSRNVLSKLADNILDIAFSYIPMVEQNYICKLFRSDEIMLVSSSRNLIHKDKIKKNEVMELPIIYSKFVKTPGFDWMEDLFPPMYRFRLNCAVMSEIVPFLLNGPYYAFLPEGLIREELADGRLAQTKLTDYEIPPLKSYGIIKSDKYMDLLNYFLDENAVPE